MIKITRTNTVVGRCLAGNYCLEILRIYLSVGNYCLEMLRNYLSGGDYRHETNNRYVGILTTTPYYFLFSRSTNRT